MSPLILDYGPDVEAAVAQLTADIRAATGERPPRWLVLALLDGDASGAATEGDERIAAAVSRACSKLEAELGPSAAIAIAAVRYDHAHRLAARVVHRPVEPRRNATDRIDAAVTNRWLGIPIFLLAMWMVFKLTTDVAAVFLDWIDASVNGPIARLLTRLVAASGLGDTWVESLLVDGVLAGVGAVLTFIPVLVLLFVALALLEDSGYMARAGFVMDRVMGGVGLPGRSFLPMLVGFGCSVPAIYATRTLDNRRDRILTGLLVPFMSCGARLPVYVLIATAFFPRAPGTVIFLIYLLGIVTALAVGAVLRRTILDGEPSPAAVLELPPYRRPTLRAIWFHAWGRTRSFLHDAGSIILATSVVVWLLMAIPTAGGAGFARPDVEDSAFGAVAGAAAPALEPLGFGSWEAAGSLMTGWVAKEVVIGTMGQVYGFDRDGLDEGGSVGDDLRELGESFGAAALDTFRAVPALVGIDLVSGEEGLPELGLTERVTAEFEETSGGHGALAGMAFMVFVLLYSPCIAAVAAERRELGARWMWTSIIGQTALAWAMALLVFQVGRIIGL